MGGPEAIKGFIFQTIYAVLDSLRNDWKTICIEPEIGNEKIDIIWSFYDGSENVCQVKSSINNFEKSNILDWISDLYKGHPTAKEYKAILIGTTDKETKNYFKKINRSTIDKFPDNHKNLHSIKEKIKVDFLPYDDKLIIEAIITQLERFLENMGKTTNLSLRELISKALITEFLILSSKRKEHPKSKFQSELLIWIKGKFPQIDKLSLAFYLTNKIPFSETLPAIRIPETIKHEYVVAKKKELLNMIDKIESYSFPENTNNSSFTFLSFNLPVSEYDKKMIKSRAVKYLNRELNDTFFNFGGLEKSSNLSSFPLSYKTKYSGSADEKAKMESFLDFKFQFECLHDLLRFWKKIQQFCFLPIILKNEGNTYQKGLTIKLRLPASIKLIKPTDFPSPKENAIIKEMNHEESILIQCYKHFKDSYVNESHSRKFLSNDFKERLDFQRMTKLSLFDETDLQKERYYEVLDYYFDFEILNDQERQIVIECEIEELKANESISLPSFIFFKAKEDFVIEYEINSNSLPQKVFGALTVKSE